MKPKGSKTLEVIPTKGTQFVSVPNTLAGREFLGLLRLYLNRGEFEIEAVRGRAKDRRKKGGNREDTPCRTADWLAVYVNRKPDPVAMAAKDRAWESAYNLGYRSGLTRADSVLTSLKLASGALALVREDLDTLEDYLPAVDADATPATEEVKP